MIKLYRMPDGIVRRYEEGKAPACASLLVPEVKPAKVEKEPEEKAIEEPENKAVKPANKAKGKAKKK